ncbi:MAG: deoxyribonuclease IV [Nitrospiraceae bacterium]|nr:deoxyribonuclease IV [Nitrospiraceae bacterium]
MARRLGVHTSIAGGLAKGLERARALGCSTLQIFSHNPRSWSLTDIPEEEARLFRSMREKLGLDPVFIHACYLINLSSSNAATRGKSIWMLAEELRRADRIGADYVIVHAGWPAAESSGGGPGYEALVQSIRTVLGKGRRKFRASLLLENTALPLQALLQAAPVAASVKALSAAAAGSGAAGLCLDTCHAFASGYDIRTAEGIREIARQTEGVKIGLIHLNDSKGAIGSGLDRHEHLGAGRIGMEGLGRFLRHASFRRQPVVLETPKKKESDDPMNIENARMILANNRSKKGIVSF